MLRSLQPAEAETRQDDASHHDGARGDGSISPPMTMPEPTQAAASDPVTTHLRSTADSAGDAPSARDIADIQRARRARRSKPLRRRLAGLDTMRYLMHRQRLLADRSGRPFAWVLLQCDSAAMRSSVSRLAMRRLRETDDIGLTPSECFDDPMKARFALLLILPETSLAGGKWVADDIANRFPRGEQPRVTAHAYPTEEPCVLNDESDEADDDFDSDDSDGDVEHPPEGLGSRGETEVESEPMVARVGATSRGTFARPLPVWKRMIDVVAAGTGLLLTAPMLGVIAAAIRLDSKGSPIFWQERAGLGGRAFRIAKFRTMIADAEEKKAALKHLSEQDGAAFKLRRDPRVTRIGRLLRATSLDELPQLWNVLKGEMTLVGPRPLPVAEAAACEPWQ
ncbi:MAG: sugar transferase, partial [Planctomycetota bacterium]